MTAESLSPRRYNNSYVGLLVNQLNTSSLKHEQQNINSIKVKRKMFHSFSVEASRSSSTNEQKLFNNKTKEGEFIDKNYKSMPYKYIPKYKNQTFIMPDRVFQKGKAGKRFFIKMKDTSVYSFQQPERQDMQKTIQKDQKQQTIISRKLEEFDRIINVDDGCKRAEINRWFLKTRKRFVPPSSKVNEPFSMSEPMLEPKERESMELKKTTLAKTYDFKNKWRPISRTSESFSMTMSNSFYSQAVTSNNCSASVR